MRIPFSFRAAVRLGLALILVAGSAILLSSSPQRAFRPQDKAYYADASSISYVRPGLLVKITSASIAADGTIQARFTLTDPKGIPLDRNGITTPGPISTKFVASWIPNNQRQYISYITRQVTSTIIGVTSVAQLDENIDIFGTTLSPEILKQIDVIRWELRDPAA